jgi:hypothetical protein
MKITFLHIFRKPLYPRKHCIEYKKYFIFLYRIFRNMFRSNKYSDSQDRGAYIYIYIYIYIGLYVEFSLFSSDFNSDVPRF